MFVASSAAPQDQKRCVSRLSRLVRVELRNTVGRLPSTISVTSPLGRWAMSALNASRFIRMDADLPNGSQ